MCVFEFVLWPLFLHGRCFFFSCGHVLFLAFVVLVLFCVFLCVIIGLCEWLCGMWLFCVVVVIVVNVVFHVMFVHVCVAFCFVLRFFFSFCVVCL